MLSNIYSYNAYNYFFYDEDQVNKAVLASFTPSDAQDIYTDPKYGMNTPRKLIAWVIAADGNFTANTEQTLAYDALKTYFAAKNMDETKLDQIVGKNSMLY